MKETQAMKQASQAPQTPKARKRRRNLYDVAPLRRAKAIKALTNREIAKAIGRTPIVVGRTIEGRVGYQGAKTIKMIADFLGVPMEIVVPIETQEDAA